MTDQPPGIRHLQPLVTAARHAGISYRQADYWATQGYIHTATYRRTWFNLPAVDTDQPVTPTPTTHGRGRIRALTATEAQVLHTMARLVRAGLTPEVAARAARETAELGTVTARLSDGLYLIVKPLQEATNA